jgi:hypothetical protein
MTEKLARARGRVCMVCDKVGPADGPIPYEWDAHLEHRGQTAMGKHKSELRMTCSPDCRAKASVKERKGKI